MRCARSTARGERCGGLVREKEGLGIDSAMSRDEATSVHQQLVVFTTTASSRSIDARRRKSSRQGVKSGGSMSQPAYRGSRIGREERRALCGWELESRDECCVSGMGYTDRKVSWVRMERCGFGFNIHSILS